MKSLPKSFRKRKRNKKTIHRNRYKNMIEEDKQKVKECEKAIVTQQK